MKTKRILALFAVLLLAYAQTVWANDHQRGPHRCSDLEAMKFQHEVQSESDMTVAFYDFCLMSAGEDDRERGLLNYHSDPEDAAFLLAQYEGTAELTPKCELPMPSDAQCWIKVVNHDDCYVRFFWDWSGDKQVLRYQSTWLGQCKAGMANGQGEEVVEYEWADESDKGIVNRTNTGQYVDGKKQGRWKWRDAEGWSGIPPYVDGLLHGEDKGWDPNGNLSWICNYSYGQKVSCDWDP